MRMHIIIKKLLFTIPESRIDRIDVQIEVPYMTSRGDFIRFQIEAKKDTYLKRTVMFYSCITALGLNTRRMKTGLSNILE